MIPAEKKAREIARGVKITDLGLDVKEAVVQKITLAITEAVAQEREACRVTGTAAANECCRQYVDEAIRRRTHKPAEGKKRKLQSHLYDACKKCESINHYSDLECFLCKEPKSTEPRGRKG